MSLFEGDEMYFADRIRIVRQQKGLSQLHMAKKLKISRQAYNNYEKGRREPDIGTLAQISDYFDVSSDYLLGLIDAPNPLRLKNDSNNELLSAIRSVFDNAAISISDEDLINYIVGLINTAVLSRKSSDFKENEKLSSFSANRKAVIEKNADEFASTARKLFLIEKKQELETCFAKEYGEI
jgi:transcriptional regulator with XRE-family HTH domain